MTPQRKPPTTETLWPCGIPNRFTKQICGSLEWCEHRDTEEVMAELAARRLQEAREQVRRAG